MLLIERIKIEHAVFARSSCVVGLLCLWKVPRQKSVVVLEDLQSANKGCCWTSNGSYENRRTNKYDRALTRLFLGKSDLEILADEQAISK